MGRDNRPLPWTLAGWMVNGPDGQLQPAVFELYAMIGLVGSAAAFPCEVPAPATAQLMVQEGSSSVAV
jgi:hypothetical protein